MRENQYGTDTRGVPWVNIERS